MHNFDGRAQFQKRRTIREDRNGEKTVQKAYRPGSVPPVSERRRPFVWDARCRTSRATNPSGLRGGHAPERNAPACRSYSVLLPVGFTLPAPLPGPRGALTAPFHPYRPAGRTQRTGGLFSVALSLGSPPPGVTRHRVSVEPGLSSPRRVSPSARRGHPAVWQPVHRCLCAFGQAGARRNSRHPGRRLRNEDIFGAVTEYWHEQSSKPSGNRHRLRHERASSKYRRQTNDGANGKYLGMNYSRESVSRPSISPALRRQQPPRPPFPRRACL